jgi:hypothetical protein
LEEWIISYNSGLTYAKMRNWGKGGLQANLEHINPIEDGLIGKKQVLNHLGFE